jgi:6-phosphofructo-2-kinase
VFAITHRRFHFTHLPRIRNTKKPKRRNLTRDSERLIIVLVGLPARGKSFISRKLLNFLNWSGYACRLFNVGRYRREAYSHAAEEGENEVRAQVGACDANFFDSKNEVAAKMRQEAAELALRDMLKWLDREDDVMDDDSYSHQPGVDRIAIFDATNSTNARRTWILEESTSPSKRMGKATGVVFVESICDDEELLRQNYKFKVSSSPDFRDMDEETALEDLKQRVAKYEETYETITDDSQSYIKIFNLSSKLMVNHIYGRMAKVIVPAIMAWNVGTRPVFLCRPGKTPHSVRTDGEDYLLRSDSKLSDLSSHNSRKGRAEKLGPEGIQFRDALEQFMQLEAADFLLKQQFIASHPSLNTGTSITGLSSFRREVGLHGDLHGDEVPFACTILTSTMPRAADTAMWETFSFPVSMNPHLNPLDKGDFEGMELDEIRFEDPKWYARLEADPYATR